MLNDADFSRFNCVYICVGRSELRKGIDGLAALVNQKFDPFLTGNLFLFCGSSNRKIKGIIWEGDGFLLIYKRLEAGTFQWPRNQEEARSITAEQFQYLMKGFCIDPLIRKLKPGSVL